MNQMRMTKTDFKTGMECLKHLWLIRHRPELRKIEPMGRLQLEGMEVGEVAANLYDHVTQVPYSKNQSAMIRDTNRALENGDPVIAEASVESEGLYCRVDFLEVHSDGVVINEVKAVNRIRKIRYKGGESYEAELLPEYLYDCAFQFHVLSKAGFNVKQVNCVHTNREYRRQGEIDYSSLFKIEDVTDEVKDYLEGDFENDLKSVLDYVEQENEPGDAICSDCRDCEMADHCWADVPSPNVWDLNGTYSKKRGQWYEKGLITFESLLEAGVLSEKGRMQVEAELYDKKHIDREKIKEFLECIDFPLYFLDFETCQKAIPEYDEQWPYEMVPFQYSLHVLREPEAELEHYEFLGDENEDSRKEIAERLVDEIPMGSCVTAYSKSFERDRLRELADLYPEYAEHLLDIAENLVDFEVPFKQYAYMIRDMHGMSTIKKVLPALCPDDETMDYSNLPGVQNGQEAMEMFLKLRDMDPEERQRQRQYMLDYCEKDTMAMVKVHEALVEACVL